MRWLNLELVLMIVLIKVIVRSATLEALDIKKKEILNSKGNTGTRNLNCGNFSYISLNHKVVDYVHQYIRSIYVIIGKSSRNIYKYNEAVKFINS